MPSGVNKLLLRVHKNTFTGETMCFPSAPAHEAETHRTNSLPIISGRAVNLPIVARPCLYCNHGGHNMHALIFILVLAVIAVAFAAGAVYGKAMEAKVAATEAEAKATIANIKKAV